MKDGPASALNTILEGYRPATPSAITCRHLPGDSIPCRFFLLTTFTYNSAAEAALLPRLRSVIEDHETHTALRTPASLCQHFSLPNDARTGKE